MSIRLSVVLVLFATVLVSLPCTAETVRVPADYATIQDGIDAARPGDTVVIASGTYVGPRNRDLDFKGKAITVPLGVGSRAVHHRLPRGGVRLHLPERGGAGFGVGGRHHPSRVGEWPHPLFGRGCHLCRHPRPRSAAIFSKSAPGCTAAVFRATTAHRRSSNRTAWWAAAPGGKWGCLPGRLLPPDHRQRDYRWLHPRRCGRILYLEQFPDCNQQPDQWKQLLRGRGCHQDNGRVLPGIDQQHARPQ